MRSEKSESKIKLISYGLVICFACIQLGGIVVASIAYFDQMNSEKELRKQTKIARNVLTGTLINDIMRKNPELSFAQAKVTAEYLISHNLVSHNLLLNEYKKRVTDEVQEDIKAEATIPKAIIKYCSQ